MPCYFLNQRRIITIISIGVFAVARNRGTPIGGSISSRRRLIDSSQLLEAHHQLFSALRSRRIFFRLHVEERPIYTRPCSRARNQAVVCGHEIRRCYPRRRFRGRKRAITGPVAQDEESRKNFRSDLHNNAPSKWTGILQLESFLPGRGLSITRIRRRDVVGDVISSRTRFPRYPLIDNSSRGLLQKDSLR